MSESSAVTVVGAGSWGTALAKHLAQSGHQVTLWAREPEVVDSIESDHVNHLFLPDARLPDHLQATSDLDRALKSAEVILSAVPTQFIRHVFSDGGAMLGDADLLVSVSKGIEIGTEKTPSEVFAEVLPHELAHSMVVLSGPSFAAEVARQLPTAVVVASRIEAKAIQARELFSNDDFRVYSSDDVVSVELGGALKNVIAIAAGISAGMGFGHNTLAALMTRGLAEITRLGVARGGHPLTFAGLSGVGDLVLTCTGSLSRNRTVGVALGQGKKLDEILGEMQMVAEGTKTVVAARALAASVDVEMPITEQVYQVCYHDKDPQQALLDLMRRELKVEREH